MTSNDKPQRPRGKPASGGKTTDRAPRAAAADGKAKFGKPAFGKNAGEKKPFEKRDGGKPAFGKPAFGKTSGPPRGKPAFAKRDDGAPNETRATERPASDRPRFEQVRSDKPWGEQPRFDKPRSEKPRSDKPRFEKAGSETDRSAKPKFDKPKFEKPRFDRQAGERSADRGGDERPARARAATATAVSDEAPQRISKILARAGVASRRDIERMIMEGRVSVNGTKLETPVVNVTLSDKIEVDGQPIRGIERTRLWLYHKPTGLVTTNNDPEGRPTVFDRLPEDLPRVLSIGRLDINTEGLLLLTNDGGLARVLELPATGWLRRYRVRAHGKIEQADLDKLKDGIAVDGVLYGAIDATLDKVQGANVWITMGLREGKNREIKNVLGALGLDVNRLIRISYGPFQLGELPEGAAQEIRGRTLRDQLGPRLIEDAKANFDAPLFNNPDADDEGPLVSTERSAERGSDRSGDRGQGAYEKPAFREKAADRNERLRGRLDTRPADNKRGGAKQGGWDSAPAARGDGPKREQAGRPRKANVWMAPGARPVAEKKTGPEAAAAEKPVRRERPEGAPKVKRYGRTKDGQAIAGKQRFDPDRKSAASFARPDTGPRVIVERDKDDRDWIKASEPPVREERGGFKSRDGGDRGDRAPRGDGDRSFGAKKSFGEKKSFGGDRPDAKPFGKSFAKPGAKAGGKPSFGGKPSGGRPSGGRPSGGKPGGAKPRGGK
ncbi:pseudouridine synthase [Rhizobium sp. NFR03]|uniref:pseudouridine synthase n=1 Tax=Rhizobium sp. NFR03 TaxID=1566263 RepID=UPI0008B31CA8|nr:pseudouridine synthase [Rhizobium sp. NFR03]SER96828.1 23S rRNA pseudouridine2605 synthase [Rhizobium sp. NFR03]